MKINSITIEEKDKLFYLEFLRMIACFLVIVNHTSGRVFLSALPGPTKFLTLQYFFVSKVAVPIYFMISGIVLLNRIDSFKKNIKRILRIVVVIIVFSLFYYVASGKAFNEFIPSIIGKNVTNAYWYLYTYLGILIMLPFLQILARNMKKKHFLYFIAISILLEGTLPMFDKLNTSFSISEYFDLPLYSMYISYLYIGYYIQNYMKIDKKSFYISIFLFFSTLFIITLISYSKLLNNNKIFTILENIAYLPVIIMSICFFIIIKYIIESTNINSTVDLLIRKLSQTTFGIYLLSDFFINRIDFIYEYLSKTISNIISLFIYELVIFLIGFFITVLLRKISIFKKYI